jgi:gluconate 2-dehydrogenase gamma chain
LVSALAEAMIPTDSTGPGAKEAGVIYFLDGQLAGDYGTSANMYFQGPWIQPSTPGPLTVQGITYSGGSAPARLTAGGGYQYPITWQNFWRNCLAYTEAYANSAYGGNFESLSAASQAACLTDLWNNKPTNFVGISPQAWFSELHDMVWAGFFTDPLYGGNQGMVGWQLTAFTGTNQGNAYGEGYTTQQLMLMTTPVRLQPQSLTQFQIAVGELPTGGA